jgi:hypothetical protein
MWIVRLALRRPYTFVVLAILLLLAGPLAILRTPTDIFLPLTSQLLASCGLQRPFCARYVAADRDRI